MSLLTGLGPNGTCLAWLKQVSLKASPLRTVPGGNDEYGITYLRTFTSDLATLDSSKSKHADLSTKQSSTGPSSSKEQTKKTRTRKTTIRDIIATQVLLVDKRPSLHASEYRCIFPHLSDRHPHVTSPGICTASTCKH